MDSLLTVGFDVPQNRPPVPLPFHQNAEWYESQRTAIWGSNIFSVTDPRRPTDQVFIYSFEQPRPNRNFTLQLRDLQQHYTILDDNRLIIELLEEEPALYGLLIDAVKPLQHAFGDKRIVHVRVLSSDEDSLLKVAVQLPANFGADPEHALQSFDEEWWLHNCHRSGGALVFDYEMQNAI